MNRKQKAVLIKFTTVIVITIIAILAMVNLKDWVNRSEAVRAMEHLGRVVLQYREKHGSVPSEYHIDSIKEKLQGHVRIGELHYRALWVDFDSTPDEILAYAEQTYHSLFFLDGFIILRLDGRIEWMTKEKLQTLLAQQQSPAEVRMLQK